MIRRLASEALTLLRPTQFCLSCRAPVHRPLPLCDLCEAELPWQIPGCQRCGVAMEAFPLVTSTGNNTGFASTCLNCQQLPPHFDRCIPVFAYQAPVSTMIRRFKEHAGFSEARCLGHLLSAAFRQFYEEQDQQAPAYLLPVPLHNTRISQRGFNQSIVLCRAIAKRSAIPVLYHACERRPGAHTQRGLSAQARQLNTRGVFYAGRQAHLTAAKHIAIIDDVVTTTATVNAISAVMRQQGAATIDIWSIARAN